jgi:hypothetical protein
MESATENSLPMAAIRLRVRKDAKLRSPGEPGVGSGDGETVRARKGAGGRKTAG